MYGAFLYKMRLVEVEWGSGARSKKPVAALHWMKGKSKYSAQLSSWRGTPKPVGGVKSRNGAEKTK